MLVKEWKLFSIVSLSFITWLDQVMSQNSNGTWHRLDMNAIYLSFQPLPSTMLQTTMPAAKLLWNSMSADTFNGMRLRTSSHEHGLLIINLLSHITYHFRCLEHVVNLTNVAVMSHIIKIAIIENSNAIWKYDPKLPGNHVLGGSLDVVAAICTLAIKVCTTSNIYAYLHSDFMSYSDPSIRTMHWILQETTLPIQDNDPTQDFPAQQYPMRNSMFNHSYKLWQVRDFYTNMTSAKDQKAYMWIHSNI